MNRAERRREEKKAMLIARKEKPIRTIEEALERAVKHHTAGRLPDAEKLYHEVLQNDPTQPMALQLLGLIAYETGEHEHALDLLEMAVTSKPDYAEAHNNMGLVLMDLNRVDEAIASYRSALEIEPNADVYQNLGNALKGKGEMQEAAKNYRESLTIRPDEEVERELAEIET
jgi:protein O-GlcNAc transferase